MPRLAASGWSRAYRPPGSSREEFTTAWNTALPVLRLTTDATSQPVVAPPCRGQGRRATERNWLKAGAARQRPSPP
ncbi:hypothetical protein [Streptomyces californicus]|uniref:hypothetical protein n=1 Tax=Streptomyces californicus TaxID=67351 RepID=UPI0037B662AB